MTKYLMLYNMSCYITGVILLYMCHVMLYNKKYMTTYFMLYNIKYKICDVI